MPEKTARALDQEIDRTRQEIAALQQRIQDMAVRRDSQSKKFHNAQILQIDLQLAHARDLLKKNPANAKELATKMDALGTERSRLLWTLDRI